MKRKLAKIMAIAFITAVTSLVSQADDCSASHCTQVSTSSVRQCELNAEIIGLTMDEYKKRGGKAATSENGRDCFCPCSCVVAENLIGTPEGYVAIEAINCKSQYLI